MLSSRKFRRGARWNWHLRIVKSTAPRSKERFSQIFAYELVRTFRIIMRESFCLWYILWKKLFWTRKFFERNWHPALERKVSSVGETCIETLNLRASTDHTTAKTPRTTIRGNRRIERCMCWIWRDAGGASATPSATPVYCTRFAWHAPSDAATDSIRALSIRESRTLCCCSHTIVARRFNQAIQETFWSIPNLIFSLYASCVCASSDYCVRMSLILHCQKTTWEAFSYFPIFVFSLSSCFACRRLVVP